MVNMKKNHFLNTKIFFILYQVLRNMEKRREILCGDTSNTFAWEYPKKHWSRNYRYYYFLSLEEKNNNDVCVSRIAKEGCFLEVFDEKYLVIW